MMLTILLCVCLPFIYCDEREELFKDYETTKYEAEKIIKDVQTKGTSLSEIRPLMEIERKLVLSAIELYDKGYKDKNDGTYSTLVELPPVLEEMEDVIKDGKITFTKLFKLFGIFRKLVKANAIIEKMEKEDANRPNPESLNLFEAGMGKELPFSKDLTGYLHGDLGLPDLKTELNESLKLDEAKEDGTGAKVEPQSDDVKIVVEGLPVEAIRFLNNNSELEAGIQIIPDPQPNQADGGINIAADQQSGQAAGINIVADPQPDKTVAGVSLADQTNQDVAGIKIVADKPGELNIVLDSQPNVADGIGPAPDPQSGSQPGDLTIGINLVADPQNGGAASGSQTQLQYPIL
uniref:Uncharacterized protein n=1 Tax=Clastoptera arizonana TaxID=38151 RepID=A0A1B6BXK3_9HEMI